MSVKKLANFLFICVLFKDTSDFSNYMTLKYSCLVNNKLECEK
jgi:hypothetical protein